MKNNSSDRRVKIVCLLFDVVNHLTESFLTYIHEKSLLKPISLLVKFTTPF